MQIPLAPVRYAVAVHVARARGRAGLTQRDVVFSVLGVCVLLVAGWKLFGGGELYRTWMCKHRLGSLGAAFAQYIDDNGRALPPAVFDGRPTNTTWDAVLVRYIANEPADRRPAAEFELRHRVGSSFHCPSDTEPRGGQQPRSYSMPLYDIKREGWPPDPSSQGGLGLYLDADRLKLARQQTPTAPADAIPSIRAAMVPDPAWTALLIERPAILNVLGSRELATTARPTEQWSAKTIALEKFHGGQLNYLMLDGRVERLTIRQSGGHAGNGGVWTIRPWD